MTVIVNKPALNVREELNSFKGLHKNAWGPAFSAYLGSGYQTPAANTFTKVVLDREYFDTNGVFDSTTNYRFQPNVAGIYQINGSVHMLSAVNRLIVAIYKNGSTVTSTDINSSVVRATTSALVYLNGNSDYVELYTYNSSGTTAIYNDIETQMSGCFIRGA